MRVAASLIAILAALVMIDDVGAQAQTPRANGETVRIQTYSATIGTLPAVIAARKGMCEKYNFKCELVTINSSSLGVQSLVGKSIDVAVPGTELAATSVGAGANIVIVGIMMPSNPLFLAVRADVPLPSLAKGYPAVIADLKGKRIGVSARGASTEIFVHVMLREAGLDPKDVTFVAVGGPAAAYGAMVVGKQVDAVMMIEPVKTMCVATKSCSILVDLRQAEGPKAIADMIGSGVPFVMRREMAEGNPTLVNAVLAAMRDAVAWSTDPANFEELVAIYTPLISLGDRADADQLRREWIKSILGFVSRDFRVDRRAVQAAIDFHLQAKTLERRVEVSKLVWDKAP